MRLGDFLIEAGVLNSDCLERALSDDSGPAERVGSKLIRSGLASPDEVAIALAKQHRVMPALVRHLVHHDPRVLSLLNAKATSDYGLLPIAISKAQDKKLVICFRDPANQALRVSLENRLGVGIIPCVASELTMRVYWEHYYNHNEFTGKDVDVNVDDFDESYQQLELVDLDHAGVEKTDRPFVLSDSGATFALKMATHRARTAEQSRHAPESSARNPFISLEDSLSSMAQASSRAELLDILMVYLRYRFSAAVFFTIKDGLALGHQGFGGHLDDPETVLALMLPLNAGMLGQAYDSKARWLGYPEDCNTTAQTRFLKLFALHEKRQAVALPIVIGGRSIALLYIHGNSANLEETALLELNSIVDILQSSFESIVRRSRLNG